jgi:hypothetical protein
MRDSNRLYFPLKTSDLEQLKNIARTEHKDFFLRNPHLNDAYYKSLIAICLCQGAAWHYLDPTIGIKDFDIWHFYLDNKVTAFPYRAHKRIENGYKARPIDFLKRSIRDSICNSYPGSPDKIVLNYLQ